MKKSERKVYIDYLRAFCCIFVVLIHVFTTARTDFVNHNNLEEIVSLIIINTFHFAVPVFFMITGYLFLSKDKDNNLVLFFKKYVLKYIIAIFTFGLGYAIIEEMFNKNYSVTMPLTALLNTLQGKTWAHMWYLYSLVGVMLMIPLIKAIMLKDKKYLKYTLIVLLLSSIVIPLIESIFNITFGFDLIIKSPYLAYCIIGYYIGTKEDNDSKNKGKKSYFYLLTISLFIIICSIIATNTNDNFIIQKLKFVGHYDSPFILCLAISVFGLFTSIKKENRIINLISKESYGIYIIHMFWINLIYKFLEFNIYGNLFFIKPILVLITVFVFSYISTIIIKKIPFINKII